MRGKSKAPVCCHLLWKIAPANGPTSMGRCSNCGAVKEFSNVIDKGTELFNLHPKDRAHIDGYCQDVTREPMARRRAR